MRRSQDARLTRCPAAGKVRNVIGDNAPDCSLAAGRQAARCYVLPVPGDGAAARDSKLCIGQLSAGGQRRLYADAAMQRESTARASD